MYKLIRESQDGKRVVDVDDEFDVGILITIAGIIAKNDPTERYGVVDKHGDYVWPAQGFA
jgi:hypothetical protein